MEKYIYYNQYCYYYNIIIMTFLFFIILVLLLALLVLLLNTIESFKMSYSCSYRKIYKITVTNILTPSHRCARIQNFKSMYFETLFYGNFATITFEHVREFTCLFFFLFSFFSRGGGAKQNEFSTKTYQNRLIACVNVV